MDIGYSSFMLVMAMPRVVLKHYGYFYFPSTAFCLTGVNQGYHSNQG